MIPSSDYLAHIRRDEHQLVAHSLSEHALAVANMAAEFAAEFNAAPWAQWAGIWHDLGKYRAGFQRYIRQCQDENAHIEGRVLGTDKTHSAAGAIWAQQYLSQLNPSSGPVIARVLSYLIAGHHAGLDNWFGGLHERFEQDDTVREGQEALAATIPDAILKPTIEMPDVKSIRADQALPIPGRFALWVRMLFSCLVDADFLDTENFMSPGQALRRQGFKPISELDNILNAYLEQMAQTVAAKGDHKLAVNRKRVEVLQACLNKAKCSSGVFTLTVPTGGGKTLSSLAFALRHAVLHNKSRVIYAIPYTGHLEQPQKNSNKAHSNGIEPHHAS